MSARTLLCACVLSASFATTAYGQRYQGNTIRLQDGASFLAAREIGPVVSNLFRNVRIFSQVGGGLPVNPQCEEFGVFIGPFGMVDCPNDGVARRTHFIVIAGRTILEFSVIHFNDNRGDFTFVAVLNQV